MPIVETIKYEGPQDALVWRNSGKEYTIGKDGSINMGSQLIVDEFYEAILFANGNALDLFKPGRHTLITQNIPMLKEQFEKLTTSTPFPVKVYFINKVHQLELKWGTQGPIMVDDPVYNIFLHVGCCGTMAIKISDSRKFLLKFVGNKETFTNADLVANLRGIISARVKDYISKIMIEGPVSFLQMNAEIADVAEAVMDALQPIFDSYGLEIQFFNIETIDVPKDDYQLLQDAKVNRAAYDHNAEQWEKTKMYEVLKTAAGNQGIAGNMMGAGMGLGMAVTVSLCCLLLTFGRQAFALFVPETEVIEIGLRVIAVSFPFYFLCLNNEVLGGVIRGAGKSLPPMLIIMFCLCGLRILLLTVFGPWIDSAAQVALVYPVTWLATATALVVYYHKGGWIPAELRANFPSAKREKGIGPARRSSGSD